MGRWIAGSSLCLGLLSACAPAEPQARGSESALNLPWPAERLAPAPYPADNSPSEEKRLLGRALFYDPLLSADRATACVTCHSEIWGLGDQLPRSVGLSGKGAIGPGRAGPHVTRRNAQTLWNAAYRESLFWDGRSDSLEEQVLVPLDEPEELARPLADVIAELRRTPGYVALFRAAFPGAEEPVSGENFARALATFVRAYVSDRAPYDQYVAGDLRALSEQDLRGLQLFAELACHDCHVPPRFESERFADRRVPNPQGVEDLGRFEVTGEDGDRNAYRVPTLRNARETGPFFHNGAVATFEAAVAHEVEEQLRVLERDPLSAEELTDLTQFLRRALADTSREQHPPAQLPSGLPLPLDGDRLLRGGHGD
jgi:cytochrome c peroxidase